MSGAAIHATALVLGEAGVLIRGPSGAGKSRLAELLLRAATARGAFASLVGDDRLRVSAPHGRLVATAHPAIAGQRELRGLGVVDGTHEPSARIALVVEITAERGARMPDAEATCTIAGISLPLLGLASIDIGPYAVALVEEKLRQLGRLV